MLHRGLDKAPAADELPYAAEVIAGDLVAVGYRQRHAQKVANALEDLSRKVDTWPTTKALIEHTRGGPKLGSPALEYKPPEVSDERREEIHQQNQALIEKLKKECGMDEILGTRRHRNRNVEK